MNESTKLQMRADAEAVNAALALIYEDAPSALRRITEAQKYSLLAGGKRIRPILTLAFCRLFGGTPEAAIPYAAAVEMIHTASLIHDDLPAIDNDELRRGRPTSHTVFGEAAAILAADGLFMDAFGVAAANPHVSPEIARDAIKTLSEATGTRGLVGGEFIDVEGEGRELDIDTMRLMHSLKTGALIKAASVLGALAAGVPLSDPRMADVVLYAENIGLAFQIVDDVLDVTGTPDTLGKNPGRDEEENKSTYLRFYSVSEASELARRLTREAVSAVEKYPLSDFLSDLASYLSERES